jgi:pimeloyl-ACP methyl ester carboxylesterase
LLIFFDGYALDTDRRELKRRGELISVEPQVFDLLVYLVQNRDRVVTKDDLIASVWSGRIVSDSTLTTRINAVRKAVGDNGKDQQVIRTIARKGVRFVGEVNEQTNPNPAVKSAALKVRSNLRHEIRFCTASDGVRIAYAEVGQGTPLVKTANWLNHLEYDWESPIWSHLLHEFAARHRLVRYDARGNGLSDWEVEDISFEAFIRDLESVVDTIGLQQFALLGISAGCAVSIAYAVRNPERVSHLVLYGGYARGRLRRGSKQELEESNIATALIRQGWGKENPAFRQFFTSLFVPGGSSEQMQWFNDLQRITTTPENAVRMRQATNVIDVSDLLPLVNVPTLVLHCRNDEVAPFDEGRRMAAGIRGSRFVALEGRNHLILEHEPAWNRFVDEVNAFIR